MIALITFAVFSSVLTADFVMWDDDWLIYHNPNLGILNLQNLWSILIDETASSSFYTPLAGLRLLHNLYLLWAKSVWLPSLHPFIPLRQCCSAFLHCTETGYYIS